MTVGDYLAQPGHLRYVVVTPAGPEDSHGPPASGSSQDPADHEAPGLALPADGQASLLSGAVLSAHSAEAAAREALRWERERLRRETHLRGAGALPIVVDLESIGPERR